MMMNRYREYLLRALPFAAAFVLFFGISALYFSPQFAGEELPQHDVVQYEGMVRDIRLQRAVTGRSVERRVGKECLSRCRSRWSAYQ